MYARNSMKKLPVSLVAGLTLRSCAGPTHMQKIPQTRCTQLFTLGCERLKQLQALFFARRTRRQRVRGLYRSELIFCVCSRKNMR